MTFSCMCIAKTYAVEFGASIPRISHTSWIYVETGEAPEPAVETRTRTRAAEKLGSILTWSLRSKPMLAAQRDWEAEITPMTGPRHDGTQALDGAKRVANEERARPRAQYLVGFIRSVTKVFALVEDQAKGDL